MKLLLFLLLPVCVLATELAGIFQNPPDAAKPRGYWIWPHGNFDYSTIKAELQEFKDKGLGGVDIFDIGISNQKNVIPPGPAFMSPEQVDGIAFALQEAKKLGLEMGLIVSSSWNAGATWTSPEQAAMNLIASIDTLQGPITFSGALPFPALPDSFYKPYGAFATHIPKDENGNPEYAKEVATLVIPLDEDGLVQNPRHVQVFTDPEIDVDLPAGQWVVMRTVCANFGQLLWVPSAQSNGLTVDHFSKQAVRDHFMEIINRLEKRCGPLHATALKRFYLASYESNADIIWTPDMPQEFYQRNSYRIEPYIPALFGVIIQNKETTERFLYDFRKTVSDIFIDHLYKNARDICHEYGLGICSEAGGPGAPLHDVPTEDLKALGALDVMRGEFWVDKRNRFTPEDFEELQIVKSIASAAHIYGHTIVEMEAFTSHDNWRQSPQTLKPFADRAFCEGMNRVVYHTMSHNLPEAGLPGWTYSAGTHINTNLTWWEMSDAWHHYLTRCSAMLQHGQFVADVCYYYGHQIPNFAKPKYVHSGLGLGYDYDDINTEVLLTANVQDGRIVLPSGMSYSVLVLPDDPNMDLEVLQKIQNLLNAGATIIGPKPERVYGLADVQKNQTELQKIADELWGKRERKKIDKRFGTGRLVAGKSERSILMDHGILPDVEFLNVPSDTTCDFIHRKSNAADIYFIRNATNNPITVNTRFRIFDKQPELWQASTGAMHNAAVFLQNEHGTLVPVHLDPHGSVFVIFRQKVNTHIVNIKKGKTSIFPSVRNSTSESISAVWENDELCVQGDAGNYTLQMNTGEIKNAHIESGQQEISGPWQVSFPFGWEAQTRQTFNKLFSWTESGDPGTRAFSGTATYRTIFQHKLVQADSRYILDLGQVGELAYVFLNGEDLGISNFSPHQFDVTAKLRDGENHLVVQVANTWLNRLIEDDKRPQAERLTHTNLARGPRSNTAWRQAEAKPSGLMGPVTIRKIQTQLTTNN